MNEIWEFQRIANKEDRSIISCHVVVALFGVELHRKSARVSFCICRPLFTANSGKADKDIGMFPNLRQELGSRVFGYVSGNLKVSVCASALGVDYTFWDTLTVEMAEFLQ